MQFTNEEKKLTQFFIQREGEGILEEIRTIDFLDAGIIDSLDLVNLAIFIEKNFDKKINLADPNVLEAARRFDSLIDLINN